MRRCFLLAILLLTAIPASAQVQQALATTQLTAGLSTVGMGTATIDVDGTWAGTITFEVTNGGQWKALSMVPPNSATAVTTTTANGVWSGSVAGYIAIRARWSTVTSGRPFITLNAAATGGGSGGGGSGGGGSGTSDTTEATQLDVLASLQTIDNVVSGAGVNVTQMNGVNVTMGNGASGTGVQRVTLANDSTGVVSLAASSANVGDVDLEYAGTAAATNSGVNGSDVLRVTIATDDQAAVDIVAIRAATEAAAASLDSIETSLSADAVHDNAATATGPQIMGEFDDSSPDTVDEGDAGRLRISANRNLYNTIRDAAGNERGANVNGSNQLTVAEGGAALTALQLIDNLATDPCSSTAKSYASVNIASATTTVVIDQSASNNVYICSINLVSGGANNIALVDDATNNCASPDSGLAGGTTASAGWNFGANGGMTLGNGFATVIKSAGTNRDTCLITSGTGQVSGTIAYVQAP